MQIEARKETLKLSELADEINNAARECDDATVATLASGMLTVQAAIRAGKSLSRVKAKLEHGKYLKWLADNCPKVSEESARRWVRLADRSRMTDLTDARSITDAFRIVAEVQGGADKEEKRALGTAAVDLYCELAAKAAKRAQGFIDVVKDVSPEELPPERMHEFRLALRPLVDFGARMGVVAQTMEGVAQG